MEVLFEDLFRCFGGHLFDFHSAFAGHHQHGVGGGAVDHDTQVQFAGDITAFFDQHLPDGLAFRTGLYGRQAVPQQASCCVGGLFGAAHQLDPALFGEFENLPFPATTGMNLGLDDGDRRAQFAKCRGRFVRASGHDTTQHRYASVAKDLLGLEFVDFHRDVPLRNRTTKMR